MTHVHGISTEVREYQNEKIEVIYRKLRPAKDSGGRFPELAPGTALKDDIRFERDVKVPMCDGVTLYTDIYRPESADNIPAIIPWSPYGKSVPYLGEGPMPGVPPVSPMTKFEGPDPAYWCKHGYALINIDVRGAGYSDGDIYQFSAADGRDAYDFIEWIAAQD